MAYDEDKAYSLDGIHMAIERIAEAQEQLAYWASVQANIAATGQGFPPIGEAEVREIMGHGDIPDDPPQGTTDTSIADALIELRQAVDKPTQCGVCGTARPDYEAARECAMSHV